MQGRSVARPSSCVASSASAPTLLTTPPTSCGRSVPRSPAARLVWVGRRDEGSYLVDPASSHMLVSKIKPCMSKYNVLYCETANGSLNQL